MWRHWLNRNWGNRKNWPVRIYAIYYHWVGFSREKKLKLLIFHFCSIFSCSLLFKQLCTIYDFLLIIYHNTTSKIMNQLWNLMSKFSVHFEQNLFKKFISIVNNSNSIKINLGESYGVQYWFWEIYLTCNVAGLSQRFRHNPSFLIATANKKERKMKLILKRQHNNVNPLKL